MLIHPAEQKVSSLLSDTYAEPLNVKADESAEAPGAYEGFGKVSQVSQETGPPARAEETQPPVKSPAPLQAAIASFDEKMVELEEQTIDRVRAIFKMASGESLSFILRYPDFDKQFTAFISNICNELNQGLSDSILTASADILNETRKRRD